MFSELEEYEIVMTDDFAAELGADDSVTVVCRRCAEPIGTFRLEFDTSVDVPDRLRQIKRFSIEMWRYHIDSGQCDDSLSVLMQIRDAEASL